MIIQTDTENKHESRTETENQGMDITDHPLPMQDNDPPPSIDTPRHPMVHPDPELNFKLDSELDVDIAFEPGDEFDFDMPQDIEPTGTPNNINDFNENNDINDFNNTNDINDTNDNIPPLTDNNSPSTTKYFNRPNDFDNNFSDDFDNDFDVDPNADPGLDFDVNSDSHSVSEFEDIEGTFMAICEKIKKNVPTRRPIPLFPFG